MKLNYTYKYGIFSYDKSYDVVTYKGYLFPLTLASVRPIRCVSVQGGVSPPLLIRPLIELELHRKNDRVCSSRDEAIYLRS